MNTKSAVRRMIAVFLALAAAVALAPGGVFAADSDMTLSLFETRLASFKANVYANGSTYVNNAAEYRGTECFGFANQISKYVFGSFPTAYGSGKKPFSSSWEINRGSEALANLHIGDVVRYRSSASADHSIFVTGMDDDYVYFSDANNDHHNTVRHNAQITWTKLTDRIDRALESDSSYVGFVAHYKYWDDEAEHTSVFVNYNANGAVSDSARLGVLYKVVTPEGLIIREGPGTSYDRVVTMRYGSIFRVLDGTGTEEANGYTWANVIFGEYSGWSAVSDPEFCAVTGVFYSGEYYIDPDSSEIRVSATGEKFTRVLTQGGSLDGADELGIRFEGKNFAGWSLSPDGEPVTAAELLGSRVGESVVLYAVPETPPPETDDPGDDPVPEVLSVCYNANGGFTESGRLGDRYSVTAYDGLIIREGPGLENKKIITMKYGSLFDVYDSTPTTESDGYTWAKVRFGEYVGWSAVSDFCRIEEQINGGVYCLGGDGSDVCLCSTGAKLVHIIDEDSKLLDNDDLGLRYAGMDFAGWSETPDGEPVTVAGIRENHQSGCVTLYALWTASAAGTAVTGDVNGDGALNNRDVVALFQYLSEGSAVQLENVAAADVNGDGAINNKDVSELFRLASEA